MTLHEERTKNTVAETRYFVTRTARIRKNEKNGWILQSSRNKLNVGVDNLSENKRPQPLVKANMWTEKADRQAIGADS